MSYSSLSIKIAYCFVYDLVVVKQVKIKSGVYVKIKLINTIK